MADLEVSSDIDNFLQAANNAAARAALGALGTVRQTFSDADVTVTAGTTLLEQTGTLSAARTVTLPAASGYPAGSTLTIVDRSGTVRQGAWINIVRAGSDTINGGTSYALYTQNSTAQGPCGVVLVSDGVSAWVSAGSMMTLNGGMIFQGSSGSLYISSYTGCRLQGVSQVFEGNLYTTTGFLEMAQISSGGTPNSNSARIYAKDVSNTAEVFVMDEAGNETQISAHSSTAPDWLYESGAPSPVEAVSYEANYYQGVVTYRHRATGRVFRETFAEHNGRLGLTGAAALVRWDWDAVQAGHVAKREEERTEWQRKRDEWEAQPEDARGAWVHGDKPDVYEAKPRPAWATDQSASILEGRARETARAALRTQWAGLPAWIRGPFAAQFATASALLDAGDDDAAEALIRFADAPSAYSAEQLAEFQGQRARLATAIAALPQL